MSTVHEKRPVIIVGAGPGGVALSLLLAKYKIAHHIVDMATFPRDKTCGDGLTAEVLRVLRLVNENYYKELLECDWMTPSYGGYFETSRGQKFHLDSSKFDCEIAPFYVAKREIFDSWLLSKLDPKYANFVQGCKISEISRTESGVEITGKKDGILHSFSGEMVVGADGERSIVRKLYHHKGIKKDRAHHIAAIRQYYKNVKVKHPHNPLECYQISKKYRGYLWIFPLANNEFNVGIGGVSEDISNSEINLKEELANYISNHPDLKDRFKDAIPLEKPKGWGIPMNSDAYDFTGERFILLGDSAKFGEPLTGKGIGVAMHSAMHAIPIIKQAIKNRDFSAASMGKYETRVQKNYRHEWKKLFFAQNNLNKLWMQALISIMSIGWINNKINKRFTDNLHEFVFRDPPSDL